jgi:uncharacterized protein (DUF58 family)
LDDFETGKGMNQKLKRASLKPSVNRSQIPLSAKADSLLGRTSMAGGIKSFVISIAFLFLFTVALLLDVQYLYFMAVMLALLQPLSWMMVKYLASRYSATRTHASVVTEGKPFPVALSIVASGGLPASLLRLEDTLPEKAFMSQSRAMLLDTWDGERGALSYSAEPLLRGVYALGPARIDTADPLGLFNFNIDLAGTSELVVHPAPLIRRSGLSGGGGVFGVREQDGAARRGEGLEFHRVRDYRSGDSLRRVHWRTSARTGQLAVIEFERAYEQNITIAIDAKLSSDFGTKHTRGSSFEYLIKLVATLLDCALLEGSGVRLLSQNLSESVSVKETTDDAARFRLFDALARMHCDAPESLAETLQTSRPKLQAGDRWIVLVSGEDAARDGALSELVRQGASVRLFAIDAASFGEETGASSPNVAGAELRIISREQSPWDDGGRHLEALLH